MGGGPGETGPRARDGYRRCSPLRRADAPERWPGVATLTRHGAWSSRRVSAQSARVELVVDGEGLGSRVRMVEDVIGLPGMVRRLLEPAIRSRNADALRRLRDLCERDGA